MLMQMRGKRSRPPSAANKSEFQPQLINTVAYQEACFIALDGNDCVYLSLSDKALEATSHGKQERKYANVASNARNANGECGSVFGPNAQRTADRAVWGFWLLADLPAQRNSCLTTSGSCFA